MKHIPLSSVEDKKYRSFGKHDNAISKQTISKVIFQLVELVEKRIRAEVYGLKGALMLDGWTHHSMHFVGMYLVYSTPDSYFENGSPATKVLWSTLVCVPPMATITASLMMTMPQKAKLRRQMPKSKYSSSKVFFSYTGCHSRYGL